MHIAGKDTENSTFIIAEAGNNHEGDPELAHRLVRLAAEAGADAIKFQTFIPEFLAPHGDAARLDRLRKFCLTHEVFASLAAEAQRAGIVFLSTPFDIESARFLRDLCPAIKIASGDNAFYPLLEEVAGYGKPIVISAGMAETAGLRLALATMDQAAIGATGAAADIAVLHCVSSYPVPPEQANLAAIPRLAAALGRTVGYSDHCIGIEAAVLSVAAGARIVEKHFTIDKAYSDFRDHALSADPDDLKAMVARIREAETLMGRGTAEIQDAEKPSMGPMRRSIAARRALPAGHVLTLDDITWARPAGGLAPGREREILGRALARDVAPGELLHDALRI